VAGLRHGHPEPGLFMISTVSGHGERFIHLLNLDGFDKTFRLYQHEDVLFGGETVNLGARSMHVAAIG
jgi:beta-galactosidase